MKLLIQKNRKLDFTILLNSSRFHSTLLIKFFTVSTRSKGRQANESNLLEWNTKIICILGITSNVVHQISLLCPCFINHVRV